MTDIQSKEVIDKISEDLKIQPAMKIPREIMDKIQLSYNVNPERLIRMAVADVQDDTLETIFTTDSSKDTFIVGATISVAKSVLSTSIFTKLLVFPFQRTAVETIFQIKYQPVTVGQFTESITFPQPIKLARNTLVQLDNSTAIASLDTSITVFFYEVDPQ